MKTYLTVIVLCCAAVFAGCSRGGSNDEAGGITVDGNSEDWAGIEPILIDPQGDAGPFDGLDVLDISVTRNAKEYFMRIRRDGTSLAAGHDYSIWVFFEDLNEGPQQDGYRLNVTREASGNTHARLETVTGTEEDEQNELLTDAMGAVAETENIELWWPPGIIRAGTYQLRFSCSSAWSGEWPPPADMDEDRDQILFTVVIEE